MQTKTFIPLRRVLSGRPPSRQRRLRVALAAIAACFAVAAAPSAAVAADPASFFWVNKVEGTIGGSALDGSNVNQQLIDLGYFKPTQLASHGDYVYWLDPSLNAVGRAKTDGTSVNRRFITGLAASQTVQVSGIAVDSSGIYWTTWHGTATGGRIARANLDGTGRDDTFVTGLSSSAIDLATDATHVFWLWADEEQTVIGRATKAGTGIAQTFVLGSSSNDGWGSPSGIAIHNGYVYWTDDPVGKIGRAKTDGTSVEASFISGLATADVNDRLVGDIVVTDSFVYWQEERSNDDGGKYGRVGRATIAGASVTPDFLKIGRSPTGLATSGTGLVWSLHQRSGLLRSALDGSSIDENFIAGNSTGTPRALVADKDYVYWLEGTDTNVIARAKRDGSDVSRNFASVGPYALSDLALDATYIYFSFESYAYMEFGSGPIGLGRIRRDGSGSSQILIGDRHIDSFAVTATHVYWNSFQNGVGPTIDRAAIDGTAISSPFITGLTDSQSELAVNDTHLFWADSWNRHISRVALNGTGLTTKFIDNTGESDSLAIDGTRLFWNGGISDNVAGAIGPGTVQVASTSGLGAPQPFVTVFNPDSVSRTDPIGDIAVARTDLTTPVPPEDPTPEPPAPPAPEPTPPAPAPVIPGGGAIGGATTLPAPPSTAAPARPRASLRSKKFRRNATVVVTLTAVPRGTRVGVSWRPKRGKTIRKTYRVRASTLKVRAPKKRGQYTLEIAAGSTRLLSKQITIR